MAHTGEVMRSLSLGQEVRAAQSAHGGGVELLRIEVTQEPGVVVPPHVHPAQEERFQVVDGAISLRIGRRRMRLTAGETAVVAAGQAHSFSACDGRPAHLVNEFRPPLRTEDCFAETFALDGAALTARQRLRGVAQIARRYPREFLFYVPFVPWQIQHRALSLLGGAGAASEDASGDRDRSPRASRWLAIYMNDQLAAGVLWREMARRAAKENVGSALGDALSAVADAIAQDVETFQGIMTRLDVPPSRIKPALATLAERGGRLKLNGRPLGYSPLSRFVELDFLAMGIEGKKILWTNLRDLAQLGDRLADIDFDALVARAHEQREQLEPFRAEAGRASLGAPPSLEQRRVPTRASVRTITETIVAAARL